MKTAILEKIQRGLSSGIDTEPKVLYLLAEMTQPPRLTLVKKTADLTRVNYHLV